VIRLQRCKRKSPLPKLPQPGQPQPPPGPPKPPVNNPNPNAPNPPGIPKPPAAPQPAPSDLGKLSSKYETGGRGSTAVSTGRGDIGGVSYGSYQMTSKVGCTVCKFVSQPDFPWKNDFKGLTAGSPQFTAKWIDIASKNPQQFAAAEHAYTQKTYYDPLSSRIKSHDGLDVSQRSKALQDVVWSTAVQHGGGTDVVHAAIQNMKKAGTFDQSSKDFDSNAIKAIYAERGRTNASGGLVYFPKSSPDVQRGVANRFKSEQADALKMLQGGK